MIPSAFYSLKNSDRKKGSYEVQWCHAVPGWEVSKTATDEFLPDDFSSFFFSSQAQSEHQTSERVGRLPLTSNMGREEKLEVPEGERDYALHLGHMELSWHVMEKGGGKKGGIYAVCICYV